LRTPEWLLVLPREWPAEDAPRPVQLFVKPEDRWEVNDVRQHHVEWAEALEQTLRAFADAVAHPGPLQVPPLPARLTAAS
jgi:hypothetical protein